jgi:zona occludens toxin
VIYLRTGANGTGKTLLTLRDVREKSLAESRPVFHNGRFKLVAEFGWKEIDIKDWQSCPDGSIFIVDECHNDFPVRSGKEPVPEFVKMLAEHRRRGFDFYLITQHPLNIDAFVRRLIGAPGWHQHLKRASGAPLVSVIEWPSVNEQCQKPGAGESGSVSMVPYPKEVYSWYESTSLDTAKLKIPFQAKVLVACVLLVPVLGYYGYKTLFDRQPAVKSPRESSQVGAAPFGAASAPVAADSSRQLTAAEYAASFAPRVDGLPYTAPRYDEQTKPVHAPYPAACVSMADRCTCYSQQGTRLDVPARICAQIVRDGFFMDWAPPTAPVAAPQVSPPPAPSPQVVATASTAFDPPPAGTGLGIPPLKAKAGPQSVE